MGVQYFYARHAENIYIIIPQHDTLIKWILNSKADGKAVVEAILASGGIPVWAHPLGGTGEKLLTNEQFANQLALLKSAGLKGLECYYSRYDEKQIQFLLETAEKNDLFTSGGSDYHGTNKTVQLGELNAFGKVITSEKITLLQRITK